MHNQDRRPVIKTYFCGEMRNKMKKLFIVGAVAAAAVAAADPENIAAAVEE